MANVANLANWIDSRLMKLEAFYTTHQIPHIEHLDQNIKPLMDAYSAQHYGQDSEMHKSNMRRMNYVINTFKLAKMSDYLRVTSFELRNEGGVDVNFVKDLRKVIIDNDGIWLDGGRGSTWPDGLNADELKRMAKKNKNGHKNGHPAKDNVDGAVNGKTVIAAANPAQEKIIVQKQGGSSLNEEQDLAGDEVVVVIEEEVVVAASDLTEEATSGTGSTETEVENDGKEIQTSAPSNQEELEEDKNEQHQGDTMTNNKGTAAGAASNAGNEPLAYFSMKISSFDLGNQKFRDHLANAKILTFADFADKTLEEIKEITHPRGNTFPQFINDARYFGAVFKGDAEAIVQEQHKKGEAFYPQYDPNRKQKYRVPGQEENGNTTSAPDAHKEIVLKRIGKKLQNDMKDNMQDLCVTSIKQHVKNGKIDEKSTLNIMADHKEHPSHLIIEIALQSGQELKNLGYTDEQVASVTKELKEKFQINLGLFEEEEKLMEKEAEEEAFNQAAAEKSKTLMQSFGLQ